jgi:beta-glucanase (GH16 family)
MSAAKTDQVLTSKTPANTTLRSSVAPFLLLLILTSLISAQTRPPQLPSTYNLVFNGTFSKLNISPNSAKRNGDYGDYTWYDGLWWETAVSPLSDMTTKSSVLTLNVSVPNSGKVYDTTIATAAPDASYYQAFQFGYFEVSMKWENTAKGAWPAFYLLPVQWIEGATTDGEIDVMEGQGGAYPNTVFGTVHEWVNSVDEWNNESSNAFTVPAGTNLSQYNTYGVLWTPGSITWYFNNQPMFTVNDYPPVIDSQNYYLILASQEGVNWTLGNTSGVRRSTTFPVQVQWVHVWQQ